MANDNLNKAKAAKSDEFYTQYIDIEKEISVYYEYNNDVFRDKVILLPCDDTEWSQFTKYFIDNFERFGSKKLISTCYAQPGATNGKIYTLVQGDKNKTVEWKYLKGNGDFRSEEVTLLRDEADIIVTNPPFSLFRSFVSWIMDGKKKFLILGNMNAITYKEIFPLIKENTIWLGTKEGAKTYTQPDGSTQTMGNTCWFTNLDHGRRHKPLQLMTMADNLKYSKHASIREAGYQKYDNYNAIEVPFVDAIPSDYDGVMGVPISFLGKYCPEQFEIENMSTMSGVSANFWTYIDGTPKYARVYIKHLSKTVETLESNEDKFNCLQKGAL